MIVASDSTRKHSLTATSLILWYMQPIHLLFLSVPWNLDKTIVLKM